LDEYVFAFECGVNRTPIAPFGAMGVFIIKIVYGYDFKEKIFTF